ncbi:uncharacterized protein LOC126550830 [Aphis gossypii]|uniref:uncharacterized protein LOC126550830 n=1 Tax=Aphis gossypii TaxID=80765 RepID=UPI0021594BA6|nr:uncharacterized protein LOC126550830 [Aphis gossypii]XP_050059119.1 uncharacterized protein LOC126550830 [Aphis gossypii]XP_050059120.1 uncharacterized protein LOC126550830 [Aphis gossypii]
MHVAQTTPKNSFRRLMPVLSSAQENRPFQGLEMARNAASMSFKADNTFADIAYVADYNLEMDLATLMTYFERFWMDQVTPLRFTVYRLQHRTNNFIESYHSSLLRLMGQRPQLYRFYDNLRTIELRARNDFTRALNGQRVRQSDYRIYPQNNTTINNAWFNVENGRYTLEDFLRNVSYTPERILRNELGEPNFEPRPAANVQPLPQPLNH